MGRPRLSPESNHLFAAFVLLDQRQHLPHWQDALRLAEEDELRMLVERDLDGFEEGDPWWAASPPRHGIDPLRRIARNLSDQEKALAAYMYRNLAPEGSYEEARRRLLQRWQRYLSVARNEMSTLTVSAHTAKAVRALAKKYGRTPESIINGALQLAGTRLENELKRGKAKAEEERRAKFDREAAAALRMP